ncbi:hypothetical protein [Rhodoferax sp.]|uniref:hypothetical protein n=1 Tax=Rhodoferax sp. TaxID=50421 RepID=UPI0025D29CF1|nr:hypothetical protein [Rhodoferax sp.]
MRTFFNFKASVLVASMLVLSAAHAANLSKDDYEVGKTRISADYKTDKAACASLAGNGKDVCLEEAKAKGKVASAELKYAYSGKPADHISALEVKAETAYAVAKEKCDDKAGNDKSVCVKEAKAVEVKAKADARTSEKIGEAKKDAAEDKRDADYKVAAQKCDALAGNAKDSCIAAAKAQFGKS